jgi:uncharacterized membrane protein
MKNKSILKRLAGYFLRGIAVLMPVGLTIFLIYSAIKWVDNLFTLAVPGIFFPGVGFVIVVIAITITGLIFSGFVGRFLFGLLDDIMTRTPLVKIIYSSLKDLINAFVGEKKKFNEPVLVTVNESGNQVFGFITRKDLKIPGQENKVAVYCPYSYALSGYVMIVDRSHVTPVNLNATEVMKFIVSGGVTGLDS